MNRDVMPYCKGQKMGDIGSTLIMLGVLGLGGYFAYKWIGNLFADKGATSPNEKPGSGTTQTDAQVAAAIQAQAGVAVGSNPFYPNMYVKNPTAASIDDTTAANLWANVQANVTNYDDPQTLPYGHSNFPATWAAFQSVVGNQVDISRVAWKCYNASGSDLLTYIQNNYTGGDNTSIQQFIIWVNALPQT